MSDMYDIEEFYGNWDSDDTDIIRIDDVIVEHEREKSWLCSSPAWTGKEWFPKSRCQLIDDCTLFVPDWLMRKKGLIDGNE